MKNYVKSIALVGILIFSFVLRFYHLETLPDAFFTDEAALGYNGWSIMTTLKDEYGQFLPITLRSFDDYKPAVYSYLTIPFIALFGLTQMSTRAPAALAGVSVSLAMYLIVSKLFKNKKIGLVSALIVAITPWHIEISRTAIEAGVALSLTMWSIWLLLKKSKYQFLSLVLFGVALFTYHTARIVTPFVLLAGVSLRVLRPTKRSAFFLVGLSLLGLGLAVTSSGSRFEQISVFSDQGSRLIREEAIREDGGPIHTTLLTTRLVHNKGVSFVLAFTKSYLTNTSLSYLFLGGAQPPRVTIPQTGQFLLIFLPFFFLGMWQSIRNWKNIDRWLFFWLLFAPIPASLTTAEIPHTYRTLFLLPPITIFITQGIFTFFKVIDASFLKKYYGKEILVGLLSFLIGCNFFIAWHQYSVHQQVHQPWYRQYGYKELISSLNNLQDAEHIVMTNRENEPYIMILFYNQVPPQRYQAWSEKRLGHAEIDQGKTSWNLFQYTFSEAECPYDVNDTNTHNYYVVKYTCELPSGFERVKRINFLDGNPEFFIDRPVGTPVDRDPSLTTVAL